MLERKCVPIYIWQAAALEASKCALQQRRNPSSAVARIAKLDEARVNDSAPTRIKRVGVPIERRRTQGCVKRIANRAVKDYVGKQERSEHHPQAIFAMHAAPALAREMLNDERLD